MKSTAHSPNQGEGTMAFDSSSSRSSTTGIGGSAGVSDGLSAVEGFDAKNAETVSDNQRPEGRTESVSGFTIGC